MSHAVSWCLCRGALHGPQQALVKKSVLVMALALGLGIASNDTGAQAFEMEKNSGGLARDISLTQTGIAIETKVYRIAEDESLEPLRLGPDHGTEKPQWQTLVNPSNPQQPQKLDAQEPGTGLDQQSAIAGEQPLAIDWATGLDPAADLAAGLEAVLVPTSEVNAGDRVSSGDQLRYELIVQNTNDFTLPAFTLEVIEQLAPDVTLVTQQEQLATDAARGWLAADPDPQSGRKAEVVTTSDSAMGTELTEPKALHWVNTQALPPSGQIVLVYDVLVVAQTTVPVPASKDLGNGVDSSQTQLQLPD